MQFRTDGFTFNNVGLGKYMGGEALLTEALRLWSRYAEVVKPSAVIRVALRYLNRLNLPMRKGDEFAVYLTKPPELPAARLKISNFLSRIVAHRDRGTGDCDPKAGREHRAAPSGAHRSRFLILAGNRPDPRRTPAPPGKTAGSQESDLLLPDH